MGDSERRDSACVGAGACMRGCVPRMCLEGVPCGGYSDLAYVHRFIPEARARSDLSRLCRLTFIACLDG